MNSDTQSNALNTVQDNTSPVSQQPPARRGVRLNLSYRRKAQAEKEAKASQEALSTAPQNSEVENQPEVTKVKDNSSKAPALEKPDATSSIPDTEITSSTKKERMTDKDWADRLHLKAIKDMKGKRYYLSAQDEVFNEEDAVKQVEYEVFRATGNMPEERQVLKILKAIDLLSEGQGNCQYSVFYRVGKTQEGQTAIDLCNSAKQYLVLDIRREQIQVFQKDKLSDVPKCHKVWFYCDSDALPLLEPEYVDAVIALALTFNYAILDPKGIALPFDYSMDYESCDVADAHEEEFKAFYSNLAEDDFMLLRGWIAYTLITTKEPGNVFPLLFLQANMGEGKTVIFRQLLHWFTDPRTDEVVRFNKNLETMGLQLNKSHTVLIDNMRQLFKDHSDFFCGTATGSNVFKRELYKNGDLYRSVLHAAVAMNGIHDTITEPDLISRTLFVQLQTPAVRLDEGELQQRFDENRPWFFAVVLRDAMRMLYHLRNHPNEVIDNGSRLVRFSSCLSALDGYSTSETLLPYLMAERQQDIQQSSLISDPLVEALHDILTESDGEYRGKTTQLLALLNDRVAEAQRPGWWPANPQQLYYRMRDQERQNRLKLLNIMSCKDQPELLNPRKGEVVYQISDFSPAEH